MFGEQMKIENDCRRRKAVAKSRLLSLVVFGTSAHAGWWCGGKTRESRAKLAREAVSFPLTDGLEIRK